MEHPKADLFAWGDQAPHPPHGILPGVAFGSVHHCAGLSRHHFGLWLASRCHGPVIWVSPAWQNETLCSGGIQSWINPGRLVFVRPERSPDLLMAAEDSLQSGAVPLVVLDLPSIPADSALKRLHTAIQAAPPQPHKPICALITPRVPSSRELDGSWTAVPNLDRAGDRDCLFMPVQNLKRKQLGTPLMAA